MEPIKLAWRCLSGLCVLFTLSIVGVNLACFLMRSPSQSVPCRVPPQAGIHEERYFDGTLRRISCFVDAVKSVDSGPSQAEQLRLLWRKDYDCHGTLVGAVSNDYGVAVEMDSTGRRVDEFRMNGFRTNATVAFWECSDSTTPKIRRIELFEQLEDGRRRELLKCLVNHEGRITYLCEGRRSISWQDGILMLTAPDAPPPFLHGETSYLIPSLSGGSPKFDTLITCSNGFLQTSHLHTCPETSGGRH